MTNKVNISEILKDYPKGFEFYSALHGKEVQLEGIGDTIISFIKVGDKKRIRQCVNQYGELYGGGECVIFPSKENRDWKTLIKCETEPHFLVGEVIKFNGTNEDNRYFKIVNNVPDGYELSSIYTNEHLKITYQQAKSIGYPTAKHFNYYHLVTFDEVLCRDYDNEEWKIEFFSEFRPDQPNFPFICMNKNYKQCIPFVGNEYLLNTKEDSDVYYYKLFKLEDYIYNK